jgi:hypothetical protein
MNDWVFALQLGIVLLVILAIAVSTIGFAFRSIRAGVEPSIEASFRKLQSGWFQLHVSIANQAPYALVVDERVKPRAARLMAPIKQVSTRKGESRSGRIRPPTKRRRAFRSTCISARKPAPAPWRARLNSKSPHGYSCPSTPTRCM